MNYLIDSNIIIYSVQPEFGFLSDYIYDKLPSYSIITKLEVLGYHQLTAEDKRQLSDLFALLDDRPIDECVIEKAINLRQQRRLTLGDSLIAATALCHQLILITRNTDDFKWIPNLTLLNPIDDLVVNDDDVEEK